MSEARTGEVEPDAETESFVRAAALLSGLPIEPEWWPEVVRNTRVLRDAAALVQAHPGSRALASAPTFAP
jgi:hypothetical protein